MARETFWKLIGGEPDRSPPNVRTTGQFDREGYRVEKLVYESRRGEWIAANFYLPAGGRAPFPGVLFQMGHSLNGKAADSYQRCCQGLVRLGFAVLAFDPMGQGERTNYPGADGLTRLGSADAEHTVPGRQMLLIGDTASRLQVLDAVRSLDILAAHPMVDRKRLASAGQSGGATLTMMLSAVDDRLAAAVVSSGNTEDMACADFRPPGSVDDAEQNFPGSAPLGFDRWDLVWPFAPKPLLLLVSAKDPFGTYSPNYLANGREEFARLEAAYRVLAKPEAVRWIESPLPHGLSYSMRLELYRWLVAWLQPDHAPVEREPPVNPEPDQQLWATRSGSVVRDLGSRTPFASLRARAETMPARKGAPDLRKVLGLSDPANTPTMRELGRVPFRKGEIVAAEVASAPHVWVPLWLFLPNEPTSRMLVILEPEGRNGRLQDDGLYQQLAADTAVCVPDLRCLGDLRPELSGGAPGYAGEHGSEENYAWASLVFGSSLLAQRVTDTLAVLHAVGKFREKQPERLVMAARGAVTIPALCAALLEPKVETLYLAGHLVSWRNLTQVEDYDYPFANFVPGILGLTDLPEIAAGIAPRRAVLAGVIDAAGKLLNEATVREAYAGGAVEIRNREPWSRETLGALLIGK